MTQLVGLTDFTLLLCVISSAMHLARIGWFLTHLPLVLIQRMLLLPVSFCCLRPVQHESSLVLFSVVLLCV